MVSSKFAPFAIRPKTESKKNAGEAFFLDMMMGVIKGSKECN